jgi:hypothetical protein
MLRTQTGAEVPAQSVGIIIRGCVGLLGVSMHEIPQRTSVCGRLLGRSHGDGQTCTCKYEHAVQQWGTTERGGDHGHTMPPRLSKSTISCFRRCSVRPAAAKATWMGIRPTCDATSRGAARLRLVGANCEGSGGQL